MLIEINDTFNCNCPVLAFKKDVSLINDSEIGESMDTVEKLGVTVHDRLSAFGFNAFDVKTIKSILRIIHTASLITEEGRFIQGSITLANPKRPHSAPLLQRADYPQFTALKYPEKLTPESFIKIARAVDKWAGSIAIWGKNSKEINIWGIVDQLVETNMNLNHELIGGFANPGILTVVIERPGDITAYHQTIFLGALRSQRVQLFEAEVFDAESIETKLIAEYSEKSIAILETVKKEVDVNVDKQVVLGGLLRLWKSNVARICIGLQRLRTGGTLIITPEPYAKLLSISRPFNYNRLASALILKELDELYKYSLKMSLRKTKSQNFTKRKVIDLWNAEADSDDRSAEITGSVKLITSLAAMDGALLLKPDLSVLGFGVKIESGSSPKKVYDGPDFLIKGRRAKTIDTSRLGTRHNSVFRYCNADPAAIGVIVSQDGHVKIVLNIENQVVLWERVQLLNQENFSADVVKREKKYRKEVGSREQSEKYGYSKMPKTLQKLIDRETNH